MRCCLHSTDAHLDETCAGYGTPARPRGGGGDGDAFLGEEGRKGGVATNASGTAQHGWGTPLLLPW